MRRLTVWIVSTATGVVLLFSYSTSTSGPAAGKVVAGIAPVGVVAELPGSAPAPPATAIGPVALPPTRAARRSPSTAASSVAAAPRTVAGPVAPTRARTTAPAPSPTPAPRKTAFSTRTINGAPADTRYGPVQVQIKVQGSRIVSAEAIVYPTNNQRDQEINSQAVPQLDNETLQAQSAQIDTVSGASYTSDGYRQSLQSALDAAHL